jgi:hypothetical protein
MSRKKDETEMALLKAKMVLRRFVNLKHALAAREELNELEPALEERYFAAVNAAQPFSFDIKELADKVDVGV